MTPASSLHLAAYIEEPGSTSYTSNQTISSPGEVEITEFDKTNNWISGTFSFVLDRQLGGEVNVEMDFLRRYP